MPPELYVLVRFRTPIFFWQNAPRTHKTVTIEPFRLISVYFWTELSMCVSCEPFFEGILVVLSLKKKNLSLPLIPILCPFLSLSSSFLSVSLISIRRYGVRRLSLKVEDNASIQRLKVEGRGRCEGLMIELEQQIGVMEVEVERRRLVDFD